MMKIDDEWIQAQYEEFVRVSRWSSERPCDCVEWERALNVPEGRTFVGYRNWSAKKGCEFCKGEGTVPLVEQAPVERCQWCQRAGAFPEQDEPLPSVALSLVPGGGIICSDCLPQLPGHGDSYSPQPNTHS